MTSNRVKENEPLPPNVRKEVLEQDGYQCQFCGRSKGDEDGFLQFEVHHKEQNPDCGYHDLDNLQTLCVDCHRWMHLKPDPEEVPITLSDADKTQLRAHDYEILQVLAENGPLKTGEIGAAITPELSAQAIRERLWRLMGLDNRVESREVQLIDQDVKTGRWGLPEAIVHSERGRIPPGIEAFIQRIEDEQVRQAVERDVDREVIAEFLNIGYRTTFYMEERARAYQFPLNDLKSDGGRPTRVAPSDTEILTSNRSPQLKLTGNEEQSDTNISERGL